VDLGRRRRAPLHRLDGGDHQDADDDAGGRERVAAVRDEQERDEDQNDADRRADGAATLPDDSK